MEAMTVAELKMFLKNLDDEVKIKLHITGRGGQEAVLDANRCVFDFMSNTLRIGSTDEV